MIKDWVSYIAQVKNFVLRHKVKLSVSGLLLILYWLWLPELLFEAPSSASLLDRNGELLAARIAADGQWRFLQSDSVPSKFKACILHFEDEYFNYHPGFNPVAIGKSLVRNVGSGKIRSGGSTLTMQLARMARRNQARSYYQKFVELLLAVRIELSYKKSSILNLYCSHAPFGGNVVGLQAAAWRYFGRSPEKLSWAESAVLAVLPNAPGLIYPGRNQNTLLKKRNRLLQKLRDKLVIDQSTYDLSVLEPLPQTPFPIPRLAPHLLDRCMTDKGAARQIHSTVDKSLQITVDELLNRHVLNLAANGIHNACAIVAETETGKVLAYVGNSSSRNNLHENFVDIANSPRSTGSILKPFLYAFMLSENRLLPEALLEDVPTRIGSYGPKNFGLSYDGLVPANQALARSLNVPAVKMLQDYGTARFHQRLKQLGFKTFSKPTDHYGLSLILGGGEATLFEVASAYASMGRALTQFSDSRQAYAADSYHPLYFIARDLPEQKKQKTKTGLLSASALYYTLSAMTELLRPQDYIGWSQFLSKSRIAWKTGTSFGFRDAWAVGLNGKYTVAVWVGNADGEGRPDLTGTAAAAPLMFSIFNVLPEKKWFNKPTSDLVRLKVCKQSGFRASEICDDVKWMDVPKGGEKTKDCPFHKLVHLDETGRSRVNSSCYPVSKMKHIAWLVLSPVQEYFYRQHNLFYKPLPPYLPGCITEGSHHQMEIVYPREGFEIYIPVDESGARSRCILKAAHKNKNAVLFWHLDGAYIGSTTGYHQLSLSPEKGEHSLEITDDLGETVSCTFKVLSK